MAPGDVSEPESEPEPNPKPNSEPEPQPVPELVPVSENGDEVRQTAQSPSPSSDGDDDLVPSLPSGNAPTIDTGDVLFVQHQKYYHPALVTRLNKKKPVIKFIYDLVKFKKGCPFTVERKACRRYSYEEKERTREEAQTADPQVAEMLLLALEALENLDANIDPVDDPEKFFTSGECDYIVRLRSASESPTKKAPVQTPVSPSPQCQALELPTAERVSPESGPGSDEDDDSEVVPLPPPPPLPPHLRAEQQAYAARLLELVLSRECRGHLRAVHTGLASSWRREAFRRGHCRRLLMACSLGDLETCPELAGRARREALRLAEGLRAGWLVSRRRYAEEVLAPEAVLFAVKKLSDQVRSAQELDAELSLGAPRFRP